MATFVLVHGAWHGGWCWRDVAGRLRQHGHQAFAPTLTGLGERVHLRTPDTDLSTHVTDVRNVLRYEDLHDVILVGHSYAGLVVRQVADQVPELIREVVLLDAWVGQTGDSFLSLAPERLRSWVESAIDGDVVRTPPAQMMGVTDDGLAGWLDPLLTPQPLRTFTEPTRLTSAADAVSCRAIVCTPSRMPFGDLALRHGWPVAEVATGHDAMLTAPTEVAELLLRSA